MKHLAVVSLLIPAALAASSGVQELKKLIVSSQASSDNDNKVAYKISQFRLKERLTAGALADISTLRLGTRTASMLELLADESEFEPAATLSGTPPPAPSEAEALLAKARDFAANYIRNLPDFICSNMIRRFETHPISRIDTQAFLGELRLQDTITTEVSFDHGKESYKAKTVNGQPHEEPVPGLTTSGEFGSILGSILIFGGTNPEWSRWESIDGKPVAVFRYSVDAAHSRYTVNWLNTHRRPKETVPAFNGELSIDPASGAIVRLTRHAVLPRESRIVFVDTVIEYQPVVIGGVSYICPVKSVTRSLWKTDPYGFEYSLNEVQFDSYHKFEGESTLLAYDPPPNTTAPPPAAPSVAAEPSAPVEAPPPAPTEQTPPPISISGSDIHNLPVAGITIRTTTRLVDVSAVVVDKNGNPVTNLKKEDFELYDEGKLQTIHLFTPPAPYVPTPAEAQPATPASPPSTPVSSGQLYTNKGEPGSRTNAITVVLLDLGESSALWGTPVKPSEEKSYSEDRLIRFLRQLAPGEQIGLYLPIANGVGIVRELSTETSDLVKIIQNWGTGPLSLQSSALAPGPLDEGRNGQAFNPHYCSSAVQLTAIAASANHLAGISGRKTLVWLTLGGPAQSGPQNCFKEEMEAQHALNKANMVLYAIDARGLQSVQADASIGSKQLGCNQGCDSGVIATVNGMARSALDGMERAHQVMLDMADKAGGRAFINGNDIMGALRTSFAESHAAYALGFYPDSARSDGSYHKLDVKVPGRPDLTVRYRRGYVDEPSDAKSQLRTALWSPLDANAIALTAQTTATDDGAFDVKLSIGIEGLDLQQEAGQWKGLIHVVFAQRDEKGQEYDYRDDTLQLDLKPETYQAMRNTGLPYHQAFKPNPKAALLRVIVRDESGSLGSVTIPLAK